MRQKILFDDSWLFHCGDITYDFPNDKGFVYASTKTESETYGPASVMYGGGRDVALLSCFCIDAFGNEVYDADAFVKFYTNELGSVIATGSDVCDHTAPHVPERKMRAGRISVAVRVGSQKGILKVYAESSGFPLAVKDIELK